MLLQFPALFHYLSATVSRIPSGFFVCCADWQPVADYKPGVFLLLLVPSLPVTVAVNTRGEKIKRPNHGATLAITDRSSKLSGFFNKVLQVFLAHT